MSAQAPIFCLHLVFSLNLRATRAPCRSRAGPSSNLGVAVSADASTFEYERHRACLSVKTSTDEPFHVPLHARTLRGAALSSWGTSLSSLVRASRMKGFQGSYGGSQLVLTLCRICIFCLQMCNRLLTLMKNGDAGIFLFTTALKHSTWFNWSATTTVRRLLYLSSYAYPSRITAL